MEVTRIQLLFQYALASAAQEDDHWDRELGPIHLLKYAYLGDLAFAEDADGETFSGIPWIFHHFGPWSVDAWKQIPEAMKSLGAAERHFSSPYQEDNIRWRAASTDDPDSLVKGLPAVAALAIRRAVHEFGTDTTSLLHHVYKTPPILRAAPGDLLAFRPSKRAAVPSESASLPALVKPSKTKLKRLRELAKTRLSGPRGKKMVPVEPRPRYDETFFEGQAWIATLGGKEVLPPVECRPFQGGAGADVTIQRRGGIRGLSGVF